MLHCSVMLSSSLLPTCLEDFRDVPYLSIFLDFQTTSAVTHATSSTHRGYGSLHGFRRTPTTWNMTESK